MWIFANLLNFVKLANLANIVNLMNFLKNLNFHEFPEFREFGERCEFELIWRISWIMWIFTNLLNFVKLVNSTKNGILQFDDFELKMRLTNNNKSWSTSKSLHNSIKACFFACKSKQFLRYISKKVENSKLTTYFSCTVDIFHFENRSHAKQ